MKRLFFLMILTGMTFAQDRSAPELSKLWAGKPQYDKGELSLDYLNSQKALKEDDFADNAKRRNFLKDRLVVQYGFGSKYGAQIDPASNVRFGVGQGLALEYITRWGVSLFVGAGGFLTAEDQGFAGAFKDNNGNVIPVNKLGHTSTRIGLGYYFLPKFALHPGLMLSYGDALVGHEADPNKVNGERELVIHKGVNIDANITYMDYGWYYLTMNFGVSIALEDNTLDGTTVIVESRSDLLNKYNPVFGFGGGIAFADMFPDITEKRRRERADARSKFD